MIQYLKIILSVLLTFTDTTLKYIMFITITILSDTVIVFCPSLITSTMQYVIEQLGYSYIKNQYISKYTKLGPGRLHHIT